MTMAGGLRAAKASLLAAPLAAGVAVLAAWSALVALDPTRFTIGPCPLLSLTGIACPLCGGTRAAYALAHGDVVTAAGHNILLVPAVLVGFILWGRWVVRRARGQPSPWLTIAPRASVVAASVLILFTILRNLPGAEGLMP